MNAVAVNHGRETQPHAELFVLDRNGHVRAGSLGDRHRKFSAGEEARLFAALGDEIRFREALELPLGLQRLDHGPELVLRVEEKQVEEVAEHQLRLRRIRVVEGRGGRPGRGARQDVLVAARAGEERRAQIRNGRPADLGEPDTEQHLVAGGAFLQPQHVDDFVGLLDVPARHGGGVVEDRLARGEAGQHDPLAAALRLDVLAGEQPLDLIVEVRKVALHHDVVPVQAAGPLPHVHRDRAGHLAVDEELVGRGDDRVGHVCAGQRHPGDRAADVDDRGAADQQPHRQGVVGRANEAGRRHRDQENQNDLAHAHCSWRTTSRARLSPRMISTVGRSGSAAATGLAVEGRLAAARVRATPVRIGAPTPKSAAGRTPGVTGIVLSSGLRRAS